ncbi:hypothetical protein TR51_19005 [Kitasatospora griseola]|uniref:Uncharacterized protein n=1 Tax=Kitasatospora griseola TaxID=2064 RepID=A0A0D0P2I4_KITGR|nr:hypothetical protein TR51_19005 [Kitasatospora griseola]
MWDEYSRFAGTNRDTVTLLNNAMGAAVEQGGAVEATFREVVLPGLGKLDEAWSAIEKFFISHEG